MPLYLRCQNTDHEQRQDVVDVIHDDNTPRRHRAIREATLPADVTHPPASQAEPIYWQVSDKAHNQSPPRHPPARKQPHGERVEQTVNGASDMTTPPTIAFIKP